MTKLENNIKQLCESVINGDPLVPLAREIFDYYQLPELNENIEVVAGNTYKHEEFKLLCDDKFKSCNKCHFYQSDCDFFDCKGMTFKEV